MYSIFTIIFSCNIEKYRFSTALSKQGSCHHFLHFSADCVVICAAAATRETFFNISKTFFNDMPYAIRYSVAWSNFQEEFYRSISPVCTFVTSFFTSSNTKLWTSSCSILTASYKMALSYTDCLATSAASIPLHTMSCIYWSACFIVKCTLL